MDQALSVGDRIGMIFNEARRIVMSAPEFAIGYVLLVSAVATVVDVTGAVGGGDFFLNVLSFTLGYFLTRAFLERSGTAGNGLKSGIGVYFGLAILSGLAIILGLLLFVIPGLILIVRWLPAYGIALVDGNGVTDAMSEAWSSTTGHTVPLAITMIAPVAMMIGGATIMAFGMDDMGAMPVPQSILSNLLIFSGTVAITAIGIAAYSLLCDRDKHLEHVFV